MFIKGVDLVIFSAAAVPVIDSVAQGGNGPEIIANDRLVIERRPKSI